MSGHISHMKFYGKKHTLFRCPSLQSSSKHSIFFKKLNRNYQQCYGSQNIVGVMASSQFYKCYLKKEYKI